MAESSAVVENDIKLDLPAQRAKIIDSVVTHGLKSSAQLKQEEIEHFASKDQTPFDQLEGVVVKPNSTQNDIEQAFYHDNTSIFPVILERKRFDLSYYYDYDFKELRLDHGVAQERMQSAFLVVTPMEGENLGPTELVEGGQVAPDEISFLIFPQTIYNEYTSKGKGITKPVKTVGKIQRKILGIDQAFEVPDFEGAIKEIQATSSQPIWIHAVRLPTASDLPK